MLIRFVLYGLLGWAIEIVWTALSGAVSGAQRGWRLAGTTYLWMFPIYGLLAPLYEPLHDAIRAWPWPLRGLLYGLGFLAVEYVADWLLRRLTGACPWDYTGRCRRHLHGLIRLDYGPLWVPLAFAPRPSPLAPRPGAGPRSAGAPDTGDRGGAAGMRARGEGREA